jgi:hypothetical protein
LISENSKNKAADMILLSAHSLLLLLLLLLWRVMRLWRRGEGAEIKKKQIMLQIRRPHH